MSGIRANHADDPDRDAADRLDALWDGLVRSGSADLSSATDGDAARLSLVSYTELLAPRSDPAARERIRRRVFADYPEDAAMRTAANVWTAAASTGAEPMPLPRPWTVHQEHRPWWRGSIGVLGLAVTAVLVLAAVGGISLFQPDGEPRSLPAAGSPDLGLVTPAPADDPASEELLTLSLDGAPNIAYSIELARVTMEGGTRWEMGEYPFAAVSAPFDLYVDTGTLTVGAVDSEVHVQDGDRPDMVGAPNYLWNPSPDPVTFVMALATDGVQSEPEVPSGVTLNPIGTVPIPTIAGNPELIVRLTHVTLVPNSGESLPIEPKRMTPFVAVESGTLLALPAPRTPVRRGQFGPDVTQVAEELPDFAEAPQDGIELGAGETLTLDRSFTILDSAAVGDEPVEVLALSYAVGDRRGPEATLNADGLPFEIGRDDGRVAFQLYRITLAPGSGWWWYRSDASLILRVIEGDVTISNGSDASSQLGPDGSIAYTGLANFQLRATAAAPAVVIAAVAFDEAHPPDMDGPDFSGSTDDAMLLGTGAANFSPGSARLTLNTETLTPDASNSLVGFHTNGAALISILSGEADVVRHGGQVTLFEDAIADIGGPSGDAHELPFGMSATASYGDAIVAQPRSAYSLSTHGDEAPLVATLSIESETPIDMTTPGPRGDEPIIFSGDACQADPRPADDLRRLVDNPTAVLDPGLRDAAAGAEEADATTAAKITATVREALACVRFGAPLQGYALFTENALLAGAVANGLTLEEIDGMEAATPDVYPDDFVGTFAIDEISLYQDGRAGAWLFTEGELAYLTFVRDQETGRWLIDAWDDRERTE